LPDRTSDPGSARNATILTGAPDGGLEPPFFPFRAQSAAKTAHTLVAINAAVQPTFNVGLIIAPPDPLTGKIPAATTGLQS